MVQGLWNISRLQRISVIALLVLLLSGADSLAQIFAPLDPANPYPAQSPHDVVLHAGTATVFEGNFAPIADATGTFLSLRPDRHGCDGFFAAVLRWRRAPAVQA